MRATSRPSWALPASSWLSAISRRVGEFFLKNRKKKVPSHHHKPKMLHHRSCLWTFLPFCESIDVIYHYFLHFRCGPCKMVAPLFAQFPAKYPKAIFLKVDVVSWHSYLFLISTELLTTGITNNSKFFQISQRRFSLNWYSIISKVHWNRRQKKYLINFLRFANVS